MGWLRNVYERAKEREREKKNTVPESDLAAAKNVIAASYPEFGNDNPLNHTKKFIFSLHDAGKILSLISLVKKIYVVHVVKVPQVNNTGKY